MTTDVNQTFFTCLSSRVICHLFTVMRYNDNTAMQHIYNSSEIQCTNKILLNPAKHLWTCV